MAKAQITGYAAAHRKCAVLEAYLARLRGVTVLEPTCGSGNFLYLALRGLKDKKSLLPSQSVLIKVYGLLYYNEQG